jgi:hypothetical protein
MIDKPDRAAKAREALAQRFVEQAGGDPVKAERLRRAHYRRLGRRSGRVRGLAAATRRSAGEAELAAEVAALGIRVVSVDELEEAVRRL